MDEESPFALGGAGIFSGNSRWIFIGIILGAIVISTAGLIFSRNPNGSNDSVPRRILNVFTHSISSSPHGTVAPEPVVVQIQPEMLNVSAILLGHPRLAVINGTQVAEGDFLLVRMPNNGVVVRLRITKIADGRVDLQNGKQTICTRLTAKNPLKRSP